MLERRGEVARALEPVGLAERALDRVRAVRLLEPALARREERADLEVVDLLQQPARALADGVIVTPTLLKLAPEPVQRVIGNLSDANQLLIALGAA